MNPFDDEESLFKVLVNGENQHCIWPAFADVPPGWTVSVDDTKRQDCLDFIEANWTDMRPKSLISAMHNGLE